MQYEEPPEQHRGIARRLATSNRILGGRLDRALEVLKAAAKTKTGASAIVLTAAAMAFIAVNLGE